MKKKVKLIVPIVILAMFLVALFNTFAMGKDKVTKLSLSDLFTIVNSASHNKGWVELTDTQVAGLAYTFVDTTLKSKNLGVEVKNIKAYIEEDMLKFKIHGKYKALSGVITILGKPDFQNKRIYYEVKKIKMGWVPIPANKIFDKFQKLEGNTKIENTTLSASSKLDMVEVDGIKIEDQKIYINVLPTLQRFNSIKNQANKHKASSVNENLNNLQSKIDELITKSTEKEKHDLLALKDKITKVKDNIQDSSQDSKKDIEVLLDKINKNTEKDQNIKEDITRVIEKINKDQNQHIKDNSEKKQQDTKKDYSGVPFYELPKEELEKKQRDGMTLLRGNLYALSGAVSNSEEVRIVNLGIATANSLITDLNYDFWGNVSTVQGIYSKFSPEQKEEFKNKIYTYIDVENVFDLKAMFEY